MRVGATPAAICRALLPLLVGALVPAGARADVVEPPGTCPEGSTDAFCHGPATCRPRGCISPSDCAAGEVCAARDLCLETHSCFGFPMPMLVDHVLGACDASGACAGGASCQSTFVCVPGPTPVDAGRPVVDAAGIDAGAGPEHLTYCGCRAPGAGSGDGAGATLGLLGAVVVLRRRSRVPGGALVRAGRRCATSDRRSRRGPSSWPSRRS